MIQRIANFRSAVGERWRRGVPLELKPIGVIHSPYGTTKETPYQGYQSDETSQIEVFDEFEEGLKGIEGLSRIVVIYWFHEAQRYHLLAKTPRDDSLHGLFITRSPHRPCPLGLTVVELVAREGNTLKVRGLDAIDGTPLLDIKPYIPGLDERSVVKSGWVESGLGEERC